LYDLNSPNGAPWTDCGCIVNRGVLGAGFRLWFFGLPARHPCGGPFGSISRVCSGTAGKSWRPSLNSPESCRQHPSLRWLRQGTTEPPQPSPAAPPPTEAMGERRHVTVMFCDLVDSTGIAAKLDAEEWRDLVGAYIDAASAAVVEMGGHLNTGP
jgi:hypothetical protein